MLRAAGELQRMVIAATDGDIGSVESFFFDDEQWTVRHIVVDTGKWLPGRRVLISPAVVERIDDERQHIVVKLTREKVRNSPDVETDSPVSRQQEIALHTYYGYGPYWGGGGLWGGGYYPAALFPAHPPPAAIDPSPPPHDTRKPGGADDAREGDPHLRSTAEVAGYHLKASDGEAGHIDDFIVDDESWAIRDLVIDTSNWPGGERVLVPVEWVRAVDWAGQTVSVDATAETVRARVERPDRG
jgi:hypothetical protein